MSPINRMLAKHRRAGRPAVGLIENLGSPEVAELMAASGPDWLAIDCEHARITPERLAHMVRGVQSVAATPILARLPDHSVSWCKWALDAGVTALAAPMVDSAAEAQRFVQQSLLPPAGRRSWGGGRAPLHFGDDYLDTINDRLALLAQIESAEGLAAVDEILAVPGLSGIL
ncbi:MAG TPA: aldolase/citrate lyase family protein, partial [Limnochordia bacterium]|nr:aldolase/citrate lyase family protein [Limnochordia bacterium]